MESLIALLQVLLNVALSFLVFLMLVAFWASYGDLR